MPQRQGVLTAAENLANSFRNTAHDPELTNAQNARDATLAAAAKVSQISLFDFLR